MIRTKENWTYGIVNIPLLYGDKNRLGVNPKTIIRKVAHNARCYTKPYYALNKGYRYLWYELDSLDLNYHYRVLNFYEKIKIDVFFHYTTMGFHYISMYMMPISQYEILISAIKKEFTNGTFYYSLRIVPNKWQDESKDWNMGLVINNGSGHTKQLLYIQQALRQPYVFDYNRTIPKTVKMLDNMFCISRYQFKRHLQV